MAKGILGSLELNRAYQMDCLEGMKLIPDKSIDLILCDLPYGTTWAKWDNIIDFGLLWKEYNRIAKGAVVLFSSQPFTTMLINSNIKNFKYTWYWKKNNAGNYLNVKRQPLRQIEEINVFNKHNYYPQGLKDYNKMRNRGSNAKTTMNNYSTEWFQEKTGYPKNILEFNLDTDKYHPTQKPVALFEYLIKPYTNENEIVLDNCLGSGTTAVACELNNRKWIGFETEKEYIEIINKRLDQIQLEDDLQDYK
ncbi:DNA-methyltransferase [Paenibacillus xylaniclasticus]|uniref:DNA-methyltransferase n=1 Tax=Paenibacillus xylaniclasticus TaxID=588083 RepID=UPI000FDC9271|nr:MULTISPECIES: site-specific DNA-methyltransferase [Paenibacillus]GFN32440.1 methyltransferase [Paenibacillus curdlanolyticus]